VRATIKRRHTECACYFPLGYQIGGETCHDRASEKGSLRKRAFPHTEWEGYFGRLLIAVPELKPAAGLGKRAQSGISSRGA
jgi:hypothetical protein